MMQRQKVKNHPFKITLLIVSFTNMYYCKIETYIPICHSREIGNPLFAVASLIIYQ